jgi:hypothetical protein
MTLLPASAYTVEYTPDLTAQSWLILTAGTVSPHPVMDGFDEVAVTLPQAPEGRGFVRLKVSGP